MITKLIIGEAISKESSPSNQYLLTMVFSAKNHEDSIETYLFDFSEEEDLLSSINLLNRYFDVNYNARCGNTFFGVVDAPEIEAKAEDYTINYEDLTTFEKFCNFIAHEWPHDSNYMPRMLDEFSVTFFDADSVEHKVELK